ncbi:hypothetical protein [Novosphingobium pentaromativorans]|uniref:Uncharacterized protein n=1 Tax=Novosphingobium pentaromativorans US6-1 TaxID=1088721 RepID=G6E8T7_9SPHN|nr:hypothetical protein [Novosphingobium pentaromativorans]AIT81229.1 hypothetical protein JI59_16295 [Novosphingobium pentaromativorans US6-1]EHJ62161.1 hypothetical protein NSU_0758 [Novosphingobium pentaromativorans US6-1]
MTFLAAIIIALLILAAVYCGGMWAWIAYIAVKDRARFMADELIEFERQTFHLGLCFILAIGFLGLITGAR